MKGKRTDRLWKYVVASAVALALLLLPIAEFGLEAGDAVLAETQAELVSVACAERAGDWLTDGDEQEAAPETCEKAPDGSDGIASFAATLPSPSECLGLIAETDHLSGSSCRFDRPPRLL